jgi:hypothetical protein
MSDAVLIFFLFLVLSFQVTFFNFLYIDISFNLVFVVLAFHILKIINEHQEIIH